MSDQWMGAGGSVWLDAILYDAAPTKADILLDGDPHRMQAVGTDTVLHDAFDPALLGRQRSQGTDRPFEQRGT